MRLLTLPAILRDAGLTVHEVDGWRDRGSSGWGPVRGITCHHTAGSRTSTDAGELRTLLHGSTSAPAPIAQLYLSRTGDWWVVASGMCFHNLTGWGGPNAGLGNGSLLGIEAQHSGGSEPWTDRQYDSYVRGVAALCRGLDVPVGRVAGHKEHQPGGKSDPTFDMDRFRAAVRSALDGHDQEEDEVAITDEVIQQIAKATAAAVHNQRLGRSSVTIGQVLDGLRAVPGALEAVRQTVGADLVDEAAIAAAVLAGLSPAQIAAAIPEGLAVQLVDELGRRLAGAAGE